MSIRAKQNMTNQLKAQLGFYKRDLEHEQKSLRKARSYLRWNLPGVKSMVSAHERGIRKTMTDIDNLKIRIRKRQRNGQCFRIL